MKFVTILCLILCSFLFGGNKKEIEIVYTSMPRRSELMLENIVEKYNKANPGVNVKVRIENHNLYKEVYDEIEIGQGPDGFVMADIHLKDAIKNNYILPLNKYLTSEELSHRNKYFPKNFVVDNKIYGYNTGSKGMALFYNKKILNEYGIPKPKDPKDIPELTKLAKEKGIIPLVNDTKVSQLRHSSLDYIIKYHLYMEEQKLFVYSKELGYKNKYEAFFSGNVAFIVGNIEDIHHSDFYRNIYGMYPLLGSKVEIKQEIFTLAYVIGNNTKYPKETMDFFRYMNGITNGYDDYLKKVM